MHVQSKQSRQKQLTNIFVCTFYIFSYYTSTYLKKNFANKIIKFQTALRPSIKTAITSLIE